MAFNENNLIIDGMIKVIQFGQDPNINGQIENETRIQKLNCCIVTIRLAFWHLINIGNSLCMGFHQCWKQKCMIKDNYTCTFYECVCA